METNFLNVDLKIISKGFASGLKTVQPSILFRNKLLILKNDLGESGRLTSDILSVTNNLKIKNYLVTMDIEKAFDSLDHSFLISVF